MTKLTKVVIEVGGKKLEFTPEEAKELKTILSDLFGGERIVERIIEKDYWHWWQPYITTYNYSDRVDTIYGNSWSVNSNTENGTVSINSVS